MNTIGSSDIDAGRNNQVNGYSYSSAFLDGLWSQILDWFSVCINDLVSNCRQSNLPRLFVFLPYLVSCATFLIQIGPHLHLGEKGLIFKQDNL